MAIHTSFLGATTVSGDEVKAFTRRLAHGRGTKAASESAQNGRKMVATFSKMGLVTVKLYAQDGCNSLSLGDASLTPLKTFLRKEAKKLQSAWQLNT